MSDTIAAIATGGQVSAIGIIRVSGGDAIRLADMVFEPCGGISSESSGSTHLAAAARKPMSEMPDRKLVYGRLHDRNDETLDLCLCTISRAPKSYTGENTVEFQCHGSPVLLRAVLEELFALGARQALPGEFSKRAFINGRMDLTSAEAVADIIDAESIEAARNAAGQLSGAIFRKADGIYSSLTDISAHYHAVLDYPDEDIEAFQLELYSFVLESSISELKKLLATFERGRTIKSGIPAAIIGRPNAGKSSLLNYLLGYERAIVTDIPGTTRDTIEEKVRLGRCILRLTDTAGIRETSDAIEKLGVDRSRIALENAELAMAVVDGNEAYALLTSENCNKCVSTVDCDIVQRYSDDAVTKTGTEFELLPETEEILRSALRVPKSIVLISKSDSVDGTAFERLTAQVTQAVRTLSDSSDIPVIRFSSVTGEGLDDLSAAVEQLFPFPAAPAGEILTNARHADAIGRALASLEAALEAMKLGSTPDIVLTETEEAMEAIGELTGRTVREDITSRIFARFCVGK